MSDLRRWLRRGLRAGLRSGARRVWADARPGSPTDLHRRFPDVAPRDGTAPTPSQRFVPRTVATGPWTDKDPLYDAAWPSRVAALTAIGFWTVVGFRLRGQVTELFDRSDAADAPEGGEAGSA